MIFPLVYHPDWSRSYLWERACGYIVQAATFWNVPQPQIIPNAPTGGRRFGTGGTHFGLWFNGTIWVNVAEASTPVRVRGRKWSYPGYKIDRTCCGILAHEFGHHVAERVRAERAKWCQIVKDTKPVSGYEPVPDEAWAESMRIFILNPDLLRAARPERFAFITKFFKPLHDASWKSVLGNAPEFILQQANKFVLEGTRKPCLL